MQMTKIEIHKEALKRAKNYKQSEAELLEVLGWLEEGSVFFDYECSSLCDYCLRHLDLTVDVAMNFIRVMRKSKEVPELKKAIKEGVLTVSKARKIVPVLSKVNTEFWLNAAQSKNTREVELLVAEKMPEEVKRHETIRTISKEFVSMTLKIKSEDFELLKRANTLLSKKKRTRVSFEETVIEMAKAYLQKNDPIEKAKRYQNKSLNKAVTGQPQPHSKQSSQKIPAHSLHRVYLRDQGKCQKIYPDGLKCESTHFTEIHHITARSSGGTHDPANLITLCSGHHRGIHVQM